MKHNKGITLVALIITIIVLLILAVVAITSISNSNILKHAQDAKEKYSIEEEKEKVTLAVHDALLENKGSINKTSVEKGMTTYFGDTGWVEVTSSDNNIMIVEIVSSKRRYKINLSTGQIELIDNNGDNPEEPNPQLDKIRLYILGENKEGRPLSDILDTDYSSENFMFFKGIEPISDAQEKISVYEYFADQKEDWIIGYNGKHYVIKFDKNLVPYFNKMYNSSEEDRETFTTEFINELSSTNTVSVDEKIYNIGAYVNYDSDNDGTYETWRVLYDDSTNGLQLIALSNSTYTLGINDPIIEKDGKTDSTNEEKMLHSYNNAIDSLNLACTNLVKEEIYKEKVRCLGTDNFNKDSDSYLNNSNISAEYNNKIKIGVKLDSINETYEIYWSWFMNDLFNGTNGKKYWLNKRAYEATEENNYRFLFNHAHYDIESDELGYEGSSIFSVNANGLYDITNEQTAYLAPIVKIKSQYKLNSLSGDGTKDNPFVLPKSK